MRVWKIAVAFACANFCALADEKKNEAPQIIAITPLRVIAGEAQTIRLRGMKLKEVSEIRCTPSVSATLKEKKDAALPTGLEAKDVGDQELVVEMNAPADLVGKSILLELVSPGGIIASREIAVVARDSEVREKEPNDGFRNAQAWDMTCPMVGKIDPEKDVDVFWVEGRAGKEIAVRIVAATAGSLLDPILTIFDADGNLLASADDSDGTRDARLKLTPEKDGALFLVVSDAHDRGGPWHEYRLERQP